MREIKFRVWDKEDKQMYYDMCYIPDWGFIKNGYEDCPWADTFESRIVMQYTGVKDANGKEIYEDDILIYDLIIPNVYLIVKWYKDAGGFFLYDKESLNNDTYWNDLYFGKECEVVSNKYENPELLEKVNGMDERDSDDM